MKRFCKAVLVAAASLALYTSALCAPLDPSAYEIEEQYKITGPKSRASWLTVFHLREPDVRLPLTSEVVPSKAGTAMNRDTLRVEWLEPGLILWVSWQMTPWSGERTYIPEMHLVVCLSEQGAEELVRECIIVSADRSPQDRQRARVEVDLEGLPPFERFIIQVRILRDYSLAGLSEAVPLGVTRADGSNIRQVRVIEESEYMCQKGFGAPSLNDLTVSVDLSAPPLFEMDIPEYKTKRVTPDELARFVDEMYSGWGNVLDPPVDGKLRIPSGPVDEKRLAEILKTNLIVGTPPDLTGQIKIPQHLGPHFQLSKDAKTVEDMLYWQFPLSSPAQWLDNLGDESSGILRFFGTVGDDLDIQMNLEFTGTAIAGMYWYDKYKKPIQLKGRRSGPRVQLEEIDEKGNVTGRFDGKFLFAVVIDGEWSSPDGTKKLPFSTGIWEKPKSEAQEPSKPQPHEIEYELVKRETPSKNPEYQHYQYELKFPNQQELIPLGRLCTPAKKEQFDSSLGFDESLFSVKQVGDSLAEATWPTLLCGQGRNQNWCTLLLSKGPKGWRSIFVDAIYESSYHFSAAEGHNITLHFQSHPDGSLTLVRETYRGSGKRAFGYASAFTHEEWPCVIEDGVVNILPGRNYGLVGGPDCADFLWKAECDFDLEGETQEERVARLRELNPGLRRSNLCSGILLLDDFVDPYKPNAEGINAYHSVDWGLSCNCD